MLLLCIRENEQSWLKVGVQGHQKAKQNLNRISTYFQNCPANWTLQVLDESDILVSITASTVGRLLSQDLTEKAHWVAPAMRHTYQAHPAVFIVPDLGADLRESRSGSIRSSSNS